MSENRCSTWVYSRWGSGDCTRAGVIERDGKLYCRQHDPVAKAERDTVKRAAWDQEHEARMVKHRLHAAAPALLQLAKDMREWDHLNGAGDGPYWKARIDAALKIAEGSE